LEKKKIEKAKKKEGKSSKEEVNESLGDSGSRTVS